MRGRERFSGNIYARPQATVRNDKSCRLKDVCEYTSSTDIGGDRNSDRFDRMATNSCTQNSEALDAIWQNEVLEGNHSAA